MANVSDFSCNIFIIEDSIRNFHGLTPEQLKYVKQLNSEEKNYIINAMNETISRANEYFLLFVES